MDEVKTQLQLPVLMAILITKLINIGKIHHKNDLAQNKYNN